LKVGISGIKYTTCEQLKTEFKQRHILE
jgi:hypothetical protein